MLEYTGEMHDGGTVPKDGVYTLKKGEVVVPKDKQMAEEKKRPHAGHGYTRTVIEHHDDGSHTVSHEHEGGKNKKYAAMDLDGVHDGLEDHLGEANGGEDHDEENEALEEKIHPGIHAEMDRLREGA